MKPGRRSRRRGAKKLPDKSQRERLTKKRAMRAILRRMDALPILDTRSGDEILGYGPNGLPGETWS